ncbi:MAG: NADP-dependent oxidoreductase [Polyangiaceae bacterium]
MRAFVIDKYGGPETTSLRDVAEPEPGAGEVRVRVHAAGLNPVDWKTRQGAIRVVHTTRFPAVLGNEFAGVVESSGPGATRFRPGDRVIARVKKGTMGAFAEVACIDESLVALAPTSVDLVTAAAIPLAGLTALQAVRDELRVGPGTNLFVSAGAGGVGTFAIQIAKRLGATVTTTASPRGEALVKGLGADRVIDYTKEKFEDVLRDMDCAFDLVGGETLTKTFGIVKRGSTVVSVAGVPEPETATKDLERPGLVPLFWLASAGLRHRARKAGVTYRYLFMHPSGTELAELVAMVDAKELRPVVDKVFPFEDMADAMAYLEKGTAKGKVLVRMGNA